MGSSAVFAGQIQTHFTRHAAAAAHIFHLECVAWMKNLLSRAVNFSSPTSSHHQVFLSSCNLTCCSPSFPFLGSSFFCFVLFCVELWILQKKHLFDLERLFRWGWVTDVIRWIWKYVDARHRGVSSQDKFIYGIRLTKQVLPSEGVFGNFIHKFTQKAAKSFWCLFDFLLPSTEGAVNFIQDGHHGKPILAITKKWHDTFFFVYVCLAFCFEVYFFIILS